MTAPWWESEALAWDTETTGLNVRTDRIVTIAIVRLGDGKPTCEPYYQVKHHGGHDAGYDALASAMVAAAIVRKYPKVAAMSLDQLHAAQVGWKAEQNTGLQRHRDDQRPAGVPDPDPVQFGWPLYDAVTGATS